MIRIGTAGWAIPRVASASFVGEGRNLTRYAAVFGCVEINSSFHRPHRVSTYARWAEETPEGFCFAVKLPRTITHDARLCDTASLLDPFIAQACGLGAKLGVLLVQLPPSLQFAAEIAGPFFDTLRSRHAGAVVCEPRHASWFTAEADALLVAHRISRAAADPAGHPNADRPGGWAGLAYHRWHGSPRTYWSAYDDDWLRTKAGLLREAPAAVETWCVFDNTAAGAAIDDALRLDRMLATHRG